MYLTSGVRLLQPVVETATFEFHGSAHAVKEAVNPCGLPLSKGITSLFRANSH